MDERVVLVPLNCLRCNTPVPAEPDQVAWACQVCGQGLLLDDEAGLQPLDIQYSADITPNSTGKPFWAATGRVSVQRQTFGSARTSDAEQFWSQPRMFLVPAFNAPLDERLTQATMLLEHPPQLNPGPPAAFQAATLDIHDVPAAVEFIIVAVEAARRDKLKQVDIQLQLTKPVLWVLP